MPSFAKIRDEEVIKAQKGLYIFGRDVREIPCFRSSIILGITCGTFAGLISFMTTSKIALSCHIGFGSLWVVVFAYWIPCRYKYETKKLIRMHEAEKILSKRNIFLRDSLVESEEEKKD